MGIYENTKDTKSSKSVQIDNETFQSIQKSEENKVINYFLRNFQNFVCRPDYTITVLITRGNLPVNLIL